MYRISVTILEAFRRYINEVSTFDTEESLLACIKGEFQGNPKTRFGGAYHKIIEGDYLTIEGSIVADAIIFPNEQALPAFEYRNTHPSIVHEMPVKKIYQTKLMPIQVSGRVDAIEGIHIRDIKTKFRKPEYEEYNNSCQWKFYLDILEADTFFYDVFEVKGFDDEYKYSYPDVRVLPPVELKCISYATMQMDLMDLLNAFIDYVENRKLFGYLKIATDLEPLFF